MKSTELSPLLFGKDNLKADAFRAASTRWQRVRPRFVSNEAQLDSGHHQGLESAGRIRQFIERRIGASGQDGWVDKACSALASSRLETEVAPTSAKQRKQKAKPKKVDRSDDGDASEPQMGDFDVAPVAISLMPRAEKTARLNEWMKNASDKEVRKLGEEALIGSNDTVSVEFFERALTASRPVGQILVAGEARGTGFFVGEGLLITNHHVIQDADLAMMSVIIMNVEETRVGPVLAQEEFSLDPAKFFLTSVTLDYTLVAVSSRSVRNTKADEFGLLPLIRGKGKILKGQPTNVIHHMGGGNKVVSFREGVLVELPKQGNATDFCYYTSDTGKGSSGSPVFNDTWEVVALHHHALPQLDAQGRVLSSKDGKPLELSAEEVSANPALRDQVAWEANEGTRISSICADITQAVIDDLSMAKLRDRLVATFLP